LCALGVLIFLMLQLPNNEAGPPPTTADYVDNLECWQCHDDIFEEFNGTGHSAAYPVPFSGGNPDCKPCHTTGAGHPEIYPDTGYDNTTNLPVYLQNVTCQACHGPGSIHIGSMDQADIGLVLNSSLCGSCHYSDEGLSGEHHPTYNEWEVSGHNTSMRLASYIMQPSCSNCHEAWNEIQYLETGVYKTVLRESGEDAPLTWDISCIVCHDPHNGTLDKQLRVPKEVLCASCHNAGSTAAPGSEPHHPMAEMRNNTAGYDIDRTGLTYMPSVNCVDCHMGNLNQAGLMNHTFAPNPAACNSTGCHASWTVEDAQLIIDSVEAETQAAVDEAGPLLDDAEALLEMMAGNRTDEDLDAWLEEYEIALFNEESVVSDSSNGNHNPDLALALLQDAVARSGSLIENLTPPAKVADVDAEDDGGGKIRVTWEATVAADFAEYRIYVLSSSKTNITADTAVATVTDKTTTEFVVEDLETNATYYVYVTAVDENGNEITNTLTGVSVVLPEEEEGGGILSNTMLILIGVIVAVVVIAAIALAMRKKKGQEPPAETP